MEVIIMANHESDLKETNYENRSLLKRLEVSEQTKDFAFAIWDLVDTLYQESSSISIYHQHDGSVIAECNNSFFCNLRYTCYDKELLYAVSVIAENSDTQGKMYLHSPKGYISKLDFTF